MTARKTWFGDERNKIIEELNIGKLKQYKDIFIDFDDTIYDTRNNAIIALAEVYEEFGLKEYFDDPNIFYDSYWDENMKLWLLYSKNEIERDYLIIERFRRPLSIGHGMNPTVEYCLKMSDRFLELCSNKPGSIDGAHELLQYLKAKGYRIHVASNGFHEIQYKKIHAAGMDDYFTSVILSEDVGVNKPSKEYFDYALKQTGAERETSIMIGDNYVNDVQGAINSGIDAILFNRWDQSFVPPEPVNHIVNYLLEIKDIL